MKAKVKIKLQFGNQANKAHVETQIRWAINYVLSQGLFTSGTEALIKDYSVEVEVK